jgi:DNA ligase D-like protein (predicted ligase)
MFDQKILPMLAYPSSPFDSPEHLYEIKWDGTRCILFVKGDQVRLQNRRLVDITCRYPELWAIHRAINAREAVLDGELIVLTEGKSDFGKLQQREHVSDSLKAELYAEGMPVMYMAFDVLYSDGRRHVQAPLRRRKEILNKLLKQSPYLTESRYVREHGASFFEHVMDHGLEGMMAKGAKSPYLIGKRSRYWLKVKPEHLAICYIVGYTPGKGARKPLFGALAVATREEEDWVYRGRVGSGLREKEMEAILARLKGLQVTSPPITAPREKKSIQWVRPELKCEVIFRETTAGGRFRAPVFRRILN